MKEDINSEDYLDVKVNKMIKEFAKDYNKNCGSGKYQSVISESADMFIRRIYSQSEVKKSDYRSKYKSLCDINRNIMINLYKGGKPNKKGDKK